MNEKVNELKDKASELNSKLMSNESKEKAKSFVLNLYIGFLKGLKGCIEWLYVKLLPKINAKLENYEKDEQ